MKKTPLAISIVAIILLVVLGGYYWKYYTPSNPNAAMKKYGAEIQKFTSIIAEKKCEAGDETYIGLAQDYTYTKDYKRALATYDTMSNCYPDAYQVLSDKRKLLMHNIGALYEDWGYYLFEQKDAKNSEKKYQEAIKQFRSIIQTFGNTDKLNADEVKSYENRIEQIQKYHLGQ